MNRLTKLGITLGIAGMLFGPALSYAQNIGTASTTTIGYFYSASGTMVDAEDNSGAMSSYLTRGIRFNGTGETFAVSNIKDVTELVDADGNVLNKYTYTAYGVPTSYSSTSINSNLNTQNSTLSLSSNPYTYSNYYTDSESGNYYLNARYYDPTIGIFLTSDTYNLPNRNMYVKGNPVMDKDPLGHLMISPYTKGEDGNTLTYKLHDESGRIYGISDNKNELRSLAKIRYASANFDDKNTKLIGEGQEGKVYRHVSPIDGSIWAVKMYHQQYTENITIMFHASIKSDELFTTHDAANRSYKIWNQFYEMSDSNDTSEYAWADEKGRLWMPFMDGETISQDNFTNEFNKFKELGTGKLAPAKFALNNKKINVTDFKPDNFLEVGGIYMPIDFGQAHYSADLNNESNMNIFLGSVIYRRSKYKN